MYLLTGYFPPLWCPLAASNPPGLVRALVAGGGIIVVSMREAAYSFSCEVVGCLILLFFFFFFFLLSIEIFLIEDFGGKLRGFLAYIFI